MKTKFFAIGMLFGFWGLVGFGCTAMGEESEKPLPPLEQVLPLAAKGDAMSENEVGTIYGRGYGVPQDYREAAKWFRQAADQGYAPAQYNLGQLYRTGKGVTQDDTEAAKWIGLAAEQGNTTAQSRLGAMYLIGVGVAQDDKEAVKWYRLAADKGNVIAQRQLGLMYALGRGVPPDDEAAIYWLGLAANSGDAEAKKLLTGMPLYKGASLAVDQGFESNPPTDASSPDMAVAKMEGTLYAAFFMKDQCIQLHSDLQPEIDRDYAAWKATEAHAISRADSRWASMGIHGEVDSILNSVAKAGIQASLDKAATANRAVGTELLCRKYFADLASGIWRERTPKIYQFLDAMP